MCNVTRQSLHPSNKKKAHIVAKIISNDDGSGSGNGATVEPPAPVQTGGAHTGEHTHDEN
jgi:hypothetical protein